MPTQFLWVLEGKQPQENTQCLAHVNEAFIISIGLCFPGSWSALGGHLLCFLFFGSQSRSWKATVCFIDSRGRGSRWVNIIDLGIWDWAKINSAEGMIKLTLSYVLHHQLFGLYSQILLWAKVRHLGFTGCVILELYSSIYYIAEYIYIVRHDT